MGILPRFEQDNPKTVTATQSCSVHLGYMEIGVKLIADQEVNFNIRLYKLSNFYTCRISYTAHSWTLVKENFGF
jgi:hypothetical protein